MIQKQTFPHTSLFALVSPFVEFDHLSSWASSVHVCVACQVEIDFFFFVLLQLIGFTLPFCFC